MTVTDRDYKIAVWCMWILSASFLVVAFFGYFYQPTGVHEFAVIVDISSYDIEFNLYRWKNSERIKKTAKLTKPYTISCSINVHVMHLDLDRLRENMFACVRMVTSQVQDFELYNATIFIYGTELTRLMCRQSPEKCNNVFLTVAEVLSAFEMRLSPMNVKPLLGFEESFFGWISVNDYFNRLDSIHSVRYGGLDLKNYSLLVSLEESSESAAPSGVYNNTQYTLYGNIFNVHGIDLMCYGIQQAYNRMLLKLMAATWGSTVKHPCHLPSYDEHIHVDTLYSPCLKKDKSPPSRQTYRVTGDWKKEKCVQLLHETLDESDAAELHNLQWVRETFIVANLTFFGFSRLSEVPDLMNFNGTTLDHLYMETVEKCTKGTEFKYARYCFDILYSYYLIAEGLRISPANVIIGHKEKIETLTGAMVFNSKDIHARRCGCIIGNFGLLYMIFSIFVFSCLGAFMSYKSNKMRMLKLMV